MAHSENRTLDTDLNGEIILEIKLITGTNLKVKRLLKNVNDIEKLKNIIWLSNDWADSRFDFHKNLMYELELNNLTSKVVMLDQNDENGGFFSRYKAAENAINHLISK